MFCYLDKESEKVLENLVARNESGYFAVYNSDCSLDILQDLIDKGYVITSQGINSDFGGYFFAIIMVTRDGKSYFERKKQFEDYSKSNRGGNSFLFANINGKFKNSVVQLSGSNSNLEISDEKVAELLDAIRKNIKTFNLTDESRQELVDLVDDVAEKQIKKPNLVKRGLQSMLQFACDVGCQTLANIIFNAF